LSSIAREAAPELATNTTMRRISLAGRLSFAIAARVAFRKLPVVPDQGYLSITFDDIPRSAWREGGPILRRCGVRATYYLSGDLCEKTVEGRAQYRRSDIDEIFAAGHEIGSHLFHHRSTLNLRPGEIRNEISLNDSFLREALGPKFCADSFAYPYGEVSVAAKILAGRRFSSARGVRPGLNQQLTDRDLLRILPADNIFAAEIDWAAIFEDISRQKTWGIVLAHGVDDSGHDYSCPPARLEAILAGAQAGGLSILPVRDVMQRLAGCVGLGFDL